MSEGTPRKDGSAPRVGRRAATLLFWCAALYVTVAGFISITHQVFSPARADWDAPCLDGLRDLESELLARASAEVAGGGVTSNEAELRRWLRDWDARHGALEDRCTGEAGRAHASLAKLRHRVETMLRRASREHAPLVRDIDRRIRRADRQTH